MKQNIPAAVLDLSATGIGIVRSLKKEGIQVYAYDTEEKVKIGKTRHARCRSCPNPLTEEQELLQFLINEGQKIGKKAVLIAGSDDYVHFISKNRYVLAQYYQFLLPEHSLVEAVLDKRLTYELAVKAGVLSPKTFAIHNEEELDQIIDQITFPCILKPVYSSLFRKKIDHRLYKKAIVVKEPSQLRDEYVLYSAFGELLIQEAIPGEESSIYSVKTFFDDEMNLIGLWMNQKLHQFPPYFGSTALAISKSDEEVIQRALDFLRKIKFKGLAISEFKRDPRDGQLKFIEINARIGLTQALSAACGVPLAYLYYLTLTGQNPAPITTQKEGIKWVYLVRDFLSYQQKRKNGEMTFTQWIKSLSGKKVEALFAWNDPFPFIRSFVSHLKNLWKRH